MNSKEIATEETQPENTQIDLGVSKNVENAIAFLENGDPRAFSSVKIYFSLLIGNLKVFDITENEVTYDQVFEKTKQMLQVRNEVVKVISSIAKFEEHSKFYRELHSFFENLLPYFTFRDEGDSRNRLAADHYEAFGSELFLYAVALMLKHRRFEQLNELTHQGYYVPRLKRGLPGEFISFNRFNQHLEALRGYYKNNNVREERQKPVYLRSRMTEGEITYEDLAQADFVLHLISLLDTRRDEDDGFSYDFWVNQVQSDMYPFELFVRSESKWFFERFTKCLRNISKEDLSGLVEVYSKKAGGRGYDFERRIALNRIAARP